MEEVKNNYIVILKSIGLAILLTLALLFVLSVILALTSVKESIMSFAIIFISALSILTSSFYASRKIKERGIFWGGAIGLAYMLILYLLSSIINSDFSVTLETAVMAFAGILGGAIGGILGVNFVK